jgi:outer membrane protein OmpA-like peptidoglycan-associated protein
MSLVSRGPKALCLLALLAVPATGGMAQPQDGADGRVLTTVYAPEGVQGGGEMSPGPKIEGIISARHGDRMEVTAADGSNTVITLTDDTRVRASGGFLGLDRSDLAAAYLMTGLPVSVSTMQGNGALFASRVNLKNRDVMTASMIHNGTGQRFAEHDTAIAQNAAATEALRGRVGDIDQYNVKATTNVNFDVDKAALSPQAQSELCATAAQAQTMENALLLVVGYTDSTGDQEYNQELSEKRAGRVVNHLQQACGWKPYRMLTPTGMSEADPLASNDTYEGKAQNRRVAVNILVSKAVDGI